MQTIDANDYVLGHDDHELARLIKQAAFYGDFTRQLFDLAGLSAGMSVLDVGCGAGDVSFLAASIVGPSGRVLGIDKSPDAVAAATRRAASAGLSNVRFVAADLSELSLDERVDAVVGRLVLLYVPDPSATLARLATFLEPGGIVAFQEMDMPGARSVPPCRLFDDMLELLCETFRRSGSDPRLGLKLGSIFERAGLHSPQMISGARLDRGPQNQIAAQLSDVIRTLLPAMERTGVASPATIDIDTLATRLCEEAVSLDATVQSPPLVGAWART
jgi:SAM-dependent methyltransferase